MNSVKVAHITTIDMSLRYLLLNQIKSLKRASYEVSSISAGGSEVPVIEMEGIRHIKIHMTRSPFTPVQDLKALCRLCLTFRREQFTIVHTHTPKAGVLGQIAAKMAGVPIIVNTLHGFYFHEYTFPTLRRFYITLEKIAACCSDVILSQNREDIETAIHERICSPKKIIYLGNGIDVRRFNPDNIPPKGIAEKRIEIGIPIGASVIGFVGRLVKEKGLLEFFAAARIVRERVPNACFLLVGPKDTQKSEAVTADIARKYHIADCCHFLGLRQDMPEIYSLMDVFVLPSHREGFPRSPMEASAMKVPCIVTNIRGCREVVEHGFNGLLVPRGDIQALADAIIKILTDSEKRRIMGEEGRRIALERFDEQVVFEKVKTEYDRLLNEKGLLPSGLN